MRSTRCGADNVQVRPERVLSPYTGSHGYLVISTKHDGKRVKHLVHRLVASAFVEGFSPDLTVNHINGVKVDNVPSNLEWVTRRENSELQWKTGIASDRGDDHVSSKLTADQVVAIKEVMAMGVTNLQLSRILGLSDSTFWKIRNGKSWAHIPDSTPERQPISPARSERP